MPRHLRLMVLVPLAALAVSCASPAPVGPSSITTSSLVQGDAPVIEVRAGAAIATKGKPEQIEGRIEGFPSSPAGTLVVEGRSVETTPDTTFLHGGRDATFADLEIGQRVKVRGESVASGLRADVVQIQNAHGSLPGKGNELTPLVPDPDPDPEHDPEPEPEPEPEPAPEPAPAFNPEPIVGMANCQSFTCGFEFVPARDMTIVALGQWDENRDGLPSSGVIAMWAVDGRLLATVTVPSGTAAPLSGAYRYLPVAPVVLTAGVRYVISSGFVGGQTPVFNPSAGMDPLLTATTGRFIFAPTYPSATNTQFFGGANFQFVPSMP